MNHYKFFSGYGFDDYKLQSFDNALLNAGIGDYNIVKISSILPPDCTEMQTIDLKKGSVIYAAYATITLAPGEDASTAVAVAKPRDKSLSGVIFEYSNKNSSDDSERIARKMSEVAMINRNRSIERIESKSLSVKNTSFQFCTLITGIALW